MKGINEKGKRATWGVGPSNDSLGFQEETWMVLVYVERSTGGSKSRASSLGTEANMERAGAPRSVSTAHNFLLWIKTKSSKSSTKLSMCFINIMCQRAGAPAADNGGFVQLPSVRRRKACCFFTGDLQKTWSKCV